MSKIIQLNEDTYIDLAKICTLTITRGDFFDSNVLTINGIEIKCTNNERDIFLQYFRGDYPILEEVTCQK